MNAYLPGTEVEEEEGAPIQQQGDAAEPAVDEAVPDAGEEDVEERADDKALEAYTRMGEGKRKGGRASQSSDGKARRGGVQARCSGHIHTHPIYIPASG